MALEFRCGRCGGKVTQSAKVCPHCGALLQTRAMRLDRCRGCGRRLEPGQWSCRACGHTEWGIILALLLLGLAVLAFTLIFLPFPSVWTFVLGGLSIIPVFSAFLGIGTAVRWPPLRTLALTTLLVVMLGAASVAARHRYRPETTTGAQAPQPAAGAALATPTGFIPTSTLAPSETPAPSPTPSITGVILPELANVRAAPSMEAAVLDGAAKNEIVTILGRTSDTIWYKIRRENGVIGWVYFELIRLDAITGSAIPEVPAEAVPTP